MKKSNIIYKKKNQKQKSVVLSLDCLSLGVLWPWWARQSNLNTIFISYFTKRRANLERERVGERMGREVSESCVDSLLTEMVSSYCDRFYSSTPISLTSPLVGSKPLAFRSASSSPNGIPPHTLSLRFFFFF